MLLLLLVVIVGGVVGAQWHPILLTKQKISWVKTYN